MKTTAAVIAIDPGPKQSGWVTLAGDGRLMDFGLDENAHIRGVVFVRSIDFMVIEMLACYGMPVGRDIFKTVFWSGRFTEAAEPLPVHRIGRKAVKLHLCGDTRAKDSNIRQALIDRYGGVGGKRAAIGLKASPGPLYGVSKDVWAALAVACTWADHSAVLR